MDILQSKAGNKTGNIFFYSFLLIYAAWLIYLCFVLNIWEDETYTLHTTSNNLADVLRLSYTFEGQPPVYFLLMAIWRLISPNVIFAKLFSIISIGFAASFFYRLVCMVSGKNSSRWLVVIFLLNPFTVWAALEIRVYAFLILLSVLASYYFIRYYINNKKPDLYAFLGLAIIGAYTQYFFTLLVASLAFSLLLYKGWKAFFRFCLYLIPVVLLFLPNFLFLQDEVQMHQQTISGNSTLKTLIEVLYTPQDFLLALQLVPFGRWARWLIKAVIALSMLFAYYKLYEKHRAGTDDLFERLNILLFSAGFLIILYCVVVVLTHIVYSAKYMAIVLPFVLLAYLLYKQYHKGLQRLLFIGCSLYFAMLLFLFYQVPVKDYDYKYAVKYVNTIERPGEPLVFYNNLIALPFSNYYTGKNVIVPLPHPVTFDSNYITNIHDTAALDFTLNQKIRNAASFLFISNDIDTIAVNKNMNRAMVDSFLVGHYNTASDTLFYGRSKDRYLRIRRLIKK